MLPFAGRRDLFVLAAGLVLGVVLGPSVLGAASPDAYRSLFGGTGAHAAAAEVRAQAEAALAEARGRSGLDAAEGEGPQGEARERVLGRLRQVEAVLAARVNAADRAAAAAMDERGIRWLLGLLVALVGIAAAEARAAPPAPPPPPTPGGAGAVEVPAAVRRLVTVRYALLAAAVAVVLARPPLFEAVPWPFVLALLGVSLAAAWVPLGRRPGHAGAASGGASGGAADPAAVRLDADASPADEARG